MFRSWIFQIVLLAKITKGILKYTCERTKFYNENQLDPWFIFENIVSNPLTANVFQKFINSKISCYIYGIDQLCSGLCLGSEGALHAVWELFNEHCNFSLGLLLVDAINAFKFCEQGDCFVDC